MPIPAVPFSGESPMYIYVPSEAIAPGNGGRPAGMPGGTAAEHFAVAVHPARVTPLGSWIQVNDGPPVSARYRSFLNITIEFTPFLPSLVEPISA
jgi:hypothetical protein